MSEVITMCRPCHTCGWVVHLSTGPQGAAQGAAVLPHPEPNGLQGVGVPLTLVPNECGIKDTCVHSEEGHVGGRNGPLGQELHRLSMISVIMSYFLGGAEDIRGSFTLYINFWYLSIPFTDS